jgi:NTP pyrophosphatase (non-canonical NTP hydrolase)
MNKILQEILTITQEEAAEVIQEICKVQRFGLDSTHKSGITNQAALEQEIGDLLAMIDLLREHSVISEAGLEIAKARKIARLHQWSNIFGETKQYNS